MKRKFIIGDIVHWNDRPGALFHVVDIEVRVFISKTSCKTEERYLYHIQEQWAGNKYTCWQDQLY